MTTEDEMFLAALRAGYGDGPLLDCGHVAEFKEHYRPGDEMWCGICAGWRLPLFGPPDA